MGALFAAFNLPGAHFGNRQKDLDQNIQAKILAGKKTFALFILFINPSARLNASAPESTFAAKITAPVAPSGNTIAKRTVYEYFQVEAFRAGKGQILDFVYA